MGQMRILTSEGDRTVGWDCEQAQAGDLEAQAAVREAERLFEEGLRRGGIAFRLHPEYSPERLDRFDRSAPQIVMVPRVTGG